MFGSQILEVVVGLVLIYLVLSIGCSGIKELVSASFSLRAKTLEEGIRSMLKGPNGDLTAALFAHPLIATLARPGEKPSYIASRTFSLALLDLLAPAGGQAPRTLAELRAGIAQLPEAGLRRTLLTLIDSSGGDLAAAREKVESWFNETMDRVSGWYKRKAQRIIFGAGLLLCGAVNADTLMVVKELWNDETLRNTVLAQAQKQVEKGALSEGSAGELSLERAVSEIRAVSVPPIGWSSQPAGVRSRPVTVMGWVLKSLGILLSAFAIVLGAPFWFDLLNSLLKLNARSAGTRPG